MNRKELETKGLDKEQIEYILAENGKDIQAEKDKNKLEKEKSETELLNAKKSLENEIETLKKQNEEFKEKINSASGIDEQSKKDIENLQKEHENELKKLRKEFEIESSKIKREADTKEFFKSLEKKFATPETEKAFEERLNSALEDKSNEGKNRQEIFEALIKNEKGEERADIFMIEGTKPPEAGGATKPLPEGNERKERPMLI